MMWFRCPYCGEPVFSPRIKMGIVSKFGTSPRCPLCKKVCFRNAAVGGFWGRGLWLYGIALVVIGVCLWIATTFDQYVFIPLGIAAFVVAYILYNYYFCYFDVAERAVKQQARYFSVAAQTEEKLWPTIRQGEIYTIQFPTEGVRPDRSPYIIGMIQTMEHKEHGYSFRIRVIRAVDVSDLAVNRSVRLVTEGDFVLEAKVTA